MLDHIVIDASDPRASRDFYVRALRPLGIEVVLEFGDTIGLGPAGKPELWLRRGAVSSPLHVAFRAQDRATVDAFHEAALAAGARDNGGPGVREIYHPHYYGAFVLDPDGHNVEAVCHEPAAS